jgi:hypothetical protein
MYQLPFSGLVPFHFVQGHRRGTSLDSGRLVTLLGTAGTHTPVCPPPDLVWDVSILLHAAGSVLAAALVSPLMYQPANNNEGESRTHCLRSMGTGQRCELQQLPFLSGQ